MTERWTDKKTGFTGSVPASLGNLSMKRFLQEQGGVSITKKTMQEDDGSEAVMKGHGMYAKVIHEPTEAAMELVEVAGSPWVAGEDLYGCLGLGQDYGIATDIYPPSLGTRKMSYFALYLWEHFVIPPENVEQPAPLLENVNPGDVYNLTGDTAWYWQANGALITYELVGYFYNYKFPWYATNPDVLPRDGYLYRVVESSLPDSILVDGGMGLYGDVEATYAGTEIDEAGTTLYVWSWTNPGYTAQRLEWTKVNDYRRGPEFGACIWAHTKWGTSFLITTSGKMYCCGGNQYGQLGIGKPTGDTPAPGLPLTSIPAYYTTRFLEVPGGPWAQVGGGIEYKWALDQDGMLWVTGADGGGIRLRGEEGIISTFTKVDDTVWYGIIPESGMAIKWDKSVKRYDIYKVYSYEFYLVGSITQAGLVAVTNHSMLQLIAAEQGNSNNPPENPFSQWFELVDPTEEE